MKIRVTLLAAITTAGCALGPDGVSSSEHVQGSGSSSLLCEVDQYPTEHIVREYPIASSCRLRPTGGLELVFGSPGCHHVTLWIPAFAGAGEYADVRVSLAAQAGECAGIVKFAVSKPPPGLTPDGGFPFVEPDPCTATVTGDATATRPGDLQLTVRCGTLLFETPTDKSVRGTFRQDDRIRTYQTYGSCTLAEPMRYEVTNCRLDE